MRQTALVLGSCLLALLAWAPGAAAHGPDTHGPDPAAIDKGRDLPSGVRARAAGSTALPTTWCGDETTADDTRNEVANGDHRYHAVYAVPADAPSRLRQAADQIQTDAMRASGLIEQLYGRAIRYDMGTGCGPQFIDITVVRLAETTAELQSIAGSPTGTLDAVARALDRNGFDVIQSGDSIALASGRNRNWVVWLDGPAPSGACGQAMLYDDSRRTPENYNNLGGKVAVVFRSGADTFCGANTVRHEIAHNLGALVSSAPNASGGHCTDAIEDTMCLPGSPERAGGAYHELFFDYGNDDYWDPPAGQPLRWWTVNLNRFLCPDANCNIPGGYAPPPPPADARGEGNGTSSTRRRARVSTRTRRYARNRWKVRVRVRGRGRAVVSISCRTSRRSRSSTVWSRSTRIPRTLNKRVRCATKPRAVAWYTTQASASSSKARERWRTSRVSLKRKSRRSRSWRLSMRIRSRGTVTVGVTCPMSRRRSRLVWSRSLRAPRSARAAVRCSRKPLVAIR